MTNIHETSIISPDVKIGDNVSIGPYCNINGDVSIKDNVTLISHISVSGSTTIGENTKICLLYTSPSPRDVLRSRMPSSA